MRAHHGRMRSRANGMQHDLPRLAPTRGPRVLCWCLMALLLLGVLAVGATVLALRAPCAPAAESGLGDAPEPIALADLGPPEAGPR